MSNYISIAGPFMNGVKPKSFFSATKDLYRTRLMHTDHGTKARLNKYTFVRETAETNPHTSELLAIAPWILGGAATLMMLFF